MILIISNKWDVTVDFVIRELGVCGHSYLRINTEDLISGQATVTLPDFHVFVSKQSKVYDLSENVHVIWNRRPGKPFDDIPTDRRPSQAMQRFINDQWYSWLECLQLVPGITWINHPHSNDAMESKIRQLFFAKQIGFTIPDTLVSNSAEAIKEKAKEHGGKIVAKALYSPLIEEPDQDYFIFTNEIKAVDLGGDEEFRISPAVFQESMTPKKDYRVTVIGDTVLPVKIESESDVPIKLDWRTQKNGLRFLQCKLPDDVEDLCRTYVREAGLLFGAIDLLEYKGNFIFLEINPNGEWGWLQKPYGVPIAKTLRDLMISEDR